MQMQKQDTISHSAIELNTEVRTAIRKLFISIIYFREVSNILHKMSIIPFYPDFKLISNVLTSLAY